MTGPDGDGPCAGWLYEIPQTAQADGIDWLSRLDFPGTAHYFATSGRAPGRQVVGVTCPIEQVQPGDVFDPESLDEQAKIYQLGPDERSAREWLSRVGDDAHLQVTVRDGKTFVFVVPKSNEREGVDSSVDLAVFSPIECATARTLFGIELGPFTQL